MTSLVRSSKAVALVPIASFVALIALAVPATAIGQVARSAATRSCAPRAAGRGPVFIFGTEGGNLRRSATKLWIDGSVKPEAGGRTAGDAALADSVSALARFARQSSFWTTIAPRITRPTRNPDMARHYVEVHLRCGVKRSLYPADAEPTEFRELFSRLSALARSAAAR